MQKDCTHAYEVCVIKRKTRNMKVYCKECGTDLTKEIALYTGRSFGEADEQPFIQPGYYAISDGNFFTGSEGSIIANLDDLINTKEHSDRSKLQGCCGLDGTFGNTLCKNGHETGTEFSDCWMPYAMIFIKEKIFLK